MKNEKIELQIIQMDRTTSRSKRTKITNTIKKWLLKKEISSPNIENPLSIGDDLSMWAEL